MRQRSRLAGLIQALANPSHRVQRLLDMGVTWADGRLEELYETAPYHRTMRQLRPYEVDQVVQAYRAGATTRELTVRFGVYRTTIGRHLHTRGVATKPPALLPENIKKAVRLYQEEWSLVRLGDRFGVGANTVRAHLLAAGVRMRPRERQPRVR